MKSILGIVAYLSLSIVLVITQPTTLFAIDQSFYAGNDILYCNPDATDPCLTSSAGSAVTGDGNVAKMWNYLVGKGLSNIQAADILGNIQEESGFSPFRQEGDAAWPSGGYGIVQWTASRRTNIVSKMNSSITASVRQSVGGYDTPGYYELHIDTAPHNETYHVILDTKGLEASVACAPQYLQFNQESSDCKDSTTISTYDFPKG